MQSGIFTWGAYFESRSSISKKNSAYICSELWCSQFLLKTGSDYWIGDLCILIISIKWTQWSWFLFLCQISQIPKCPIFILFLANSAWNWGLQWWVWNWIWWRQWTWDLFFSHLPLVIDVSYSNLLFQN